tara:strand:- start:282 stop:416 length:135 start_codon:yes stop_codon:yes gene_type:complete
LETKNYHLLIKLKKELVMVKVEKGGFLPTYRIEVATVIYTTTIK